MTRLRVALADDHPIVLAGIKALLQATPDIDVVGHAATGLVALDMIRDVRPDVAVIDISMPDLNGIDLAIRLAQDCPVVRLLALTGHEDQPYLHQMLATCSSGRPRKNSCAPSAPWPREGCSWTQPSLARHLLQRPNLHCRRAMSSSALGRRMCCVTPRGD